MRHPRWTAACIVVAFALAACAAHGTEVSVTRSALQHGDPDAAPEFAALPDVQATQQTPRVVRGLSLARDVLQHGLPTPPDDRRYAALQAWIDRAVVPWVESRRDSLDETRYQFGIPAGAEPKPAAGSEPESAIAWGVLALLEENTARELSRIPSPTELDTEPDIADIFRELVGKQARPFRSAALAKYRKCYDLGVHAGSEVADWAQFCGLRYERVHRELHDGS